MNEEMEKENVYFQKFSYPFHFPENECMDAYLSCFQPIPRADCTEAE